MPVYRSPGGFNYNRRSSESRCRFEGARLSIPMITTNVLSADDLLTKPLLSTAARVGVRYYKLGYYATSRNGRKRLWLLVES
jgi:hypothetical protein